MAVIVASGHTRFHFGNCERTAWRRSFFAFAMIRRGLRFDQKPCPVRLSKIQNYLTDNLYVFMLSELKAWVNKKRGGLRTQFQFGNLAAVFRDRRISGGPLPRCQLVASPPAKNARRAGPPFLRGVKAWASPQRENQTKMLEHNLSCYVADQLSASASSLRRCTFISNSFIISLADSL